VRESIPTLSQETLGGNSQPRVRRTRPQLVGRHPEVRAMAGAVTDLSHGSPAYSVCRC